MPVLPRFPPRKLLKGRDANLILDYITSALALPDVIQNAISAPISYGGKIVTSVVGSSGVTTSASTGDVTVSALAASSSYMARAYHSVDRGMGADYSGSTWNSNPAGFMCDTIQLDPHAEFTQIAPYGTDPSNMPNTIQFTAHATGIYLFTIRLELETQQLSNASPGTYSEEYDRFRPVFSGSADWGYCDGTWIRHVSGLYPADNMSVALRWGGAVSLTAAQTVIFTFRQPEIPQAIYKGGSNVTYWEVAKIG